MQEPEKLRITYNLSLEDLVVAYVHQSTPTPAMRRKWYQTCLYTEMGVLGTFGILFSLILDTNSIGAIRCALAVCLVLIYIFWLSYRQTTPKALRKQAIDYYTNYAYPGLIGEHTLEIDANRIIHTSSHNRNEYIWDSLHKIDSAEGYTYLSIGALVFILHPASVTSGNLGAFLEGVAEYHKTATQITER